MSIYRKKSKINVYSFGHEINKRLYILIAFTILKMIDRIERLSKIHCQIDFYIFHIYTAVIFDC